MGIEIDQQIEVHNSKKMKLLERVMGVAVTLEFLSALGILATHGEHGTTAALAAIALIVIDGTIMAVEEHKIMNAQMTGTTYVPARR